MVNFALGWYVLLSCVCREGIFESPIQQTVSDNSDNNDNNDNNDNSAISSFTLFTQSTNARNSFLLPFCHSANLHFLPFIPYLIPTSFESSDSL